MMSGIENFDDAKLEFGFEACLPALRNPLTVELCLNPDGRLWCETLEGNFTQIGTIDRGRALSALNIVAKRLNDGVLTRKSPLVEGELEILGRRFRFAGQIPPVVARPTFSIRVPASRVFSLDEYVQSGVMTVPQRQIIADLVRDHRNILVMGGTGSGKTTLLNGIIHEIVAQYPDERILIMEDTGEVQCAAENSVIYRANGDVSLSDLLKTSLRMRPDRILVGEVRDHAALDLLDAWNTGHEGGIATVHANNVYDGLTRLHSMVSRNPYAPRMIEPVIGQAVHAVVHIVKGTQGRRINGILAVHGWDRKTGEYRSTEY